MARNITVTFEDGSQHVYSNAPDNVTPDEVSQRAARDFGKAVTALDGGRGAPSNSRGTGFQDPRLVGGATEKDQIQRPTEPKPRSTGQELVRQGGLTARYAMEGLPQTLDVLSSPFRVGMNKVNALMGGDPEYFKPMSENASSLADRMGLPQPEGHLERVVGDATRNVAGAAGGVGTANMLAKTATGPVTKVVAQKMASGPGSQAVASATGGAAGSEVREQGGTAGGQFLATLAGGFAGAAGMSTLTGLATNTTNALRRAMDPGRLDATLKIELRNAGIDWDNLGAAAKIQLRKDAADAVYSGKPLDTAAMRRLADFRAVGATPLVGDITQDPTLLTQQRNLAKQLANTRVQVGGGPSLPELQNHNAGRVISSLSQVAESPLDAYATGQKVIDLVKARDTALKTGETALYDQARNAAGRTIPLDRADFVSQAHRNLVDTNRMSFLPESVGKMLDQISKGVVTVGDQVHEVPFTVDTIDQMKTVLSSASRSTQDGNAKAAIKAVRDALENVQVGKTSSNALVPSGSTATSGDLPANALAMFDQARGAARDRRTWQESAGFIKDALDGGAPDAFVNRHVIRSTVEDLAKLKQEINPSSPSGVPNKLSGDQTQAYDAVRKQLVDYIMQRGRADGDVRTFSSAGMKDALTAIGERKLALFFSPDEIQQIKSAVNVGRYMQSQPIGSAVNNSNSGAFLLGKLGDLASTAGAIPGVGPMVADPLNQLVGRLQVRSLGNLSSGLVAPQAGQAPGSNALATANALMQADQQRRQKDRRPTNMLATP